MLSDDLERSIGNRSCDALKQVEVSSKRSESICTHSLENSGYFDDAKTEFPLEDPISHHLSHSCISERKSCGTGDIINPQPRCDFLKDVSVDKGDTTGKCGCSHLGGHAKWSALRTTTTQDCGVTWAECRDGGDVGYVHCELSFGQPVELCCGLHRPTRCEARNEPTDVSSDASSVYDVHTEPNCSKCADTGEMGERVRGRWSSIADEKQGKREFDDQCLKTLILIRQQIDMCCECIQRGLQCLSSTTDPLSPASDGGKRCLFGSYAFWTSDWSVISDLAFIMLYAMSINQAMFYSAFIHTIIYFSQISTWEFCRLPLDGCSLSSECY